MIIILITTLTKSKQLPFIGYRFWVAFQTGPNLKNIVFKNKDKLKPNSYHGMHELKWSCWSVYNGETKKKILSRSTEHQQESTKGNWSSSGATEHTKECHGYLDWLQPRTLSMNNMYYDRKVRESLEIDMAVVRYGRDKVLNWDNGIFVKRNAWKPLFKKMKALHWNLTSFCIKWRFSVVLWSVWKSLQAVWLKYYVLNNKTFAVILADFDV